MTFKLPVVIPALCVVGFLSYEGCREAVKLDDSMIDRHASVGLFRPRQARVITDNDAAFAAKLRRVESARASIDMLYYVYRDDYSSSVFSQALLDAVSRGVEVRILLDYSKNYPRLDFFTMLERAAAAGPGSLQVRFYNRPTRRIIEDAVFMTIGCSEILESGEEACDQRKFELIERAFAAERIDGKPPPRNVSNLNLAKSGLFLSGWYGKRPEVMALAVIEGQGLDLKSLAGSVSGSGKTLESLKRLARIYWRSRSGPWFQRLVNKLKLSLALLLYGGKIEQLTDSVSSILPIGRDDGRSDWRDWENLTDYLHQKLLLVDGETVQLGGRNLGDSYHLHDDPLLGDKALFADTDLYAELAESEGQALREVYDRLWSFVTMVATTAEIRQHAPNDFVANKGAFDRAEEECVDEPEGRTPEEQRESCVDRVFAATARDLDGRVAAQRQLMSRNADAYRERYPAEPAPSPAAPTFEIDGQARLAYLENLPFDKNLAASDRTRLYGPRGLKEAESGKYLHQLWRQGLVDACVRATAAAPRRVVFFNAYFLPSANLLRTAGWMVDGSLDCRHVTVQVLTNSVETTDFQIINPLAHHGVKAFSEFYRDHGDPAKQAKFEFYEYRPSLEIPNLSLHTKVVVFGDDVFVGSANADVRSYMMDSNNGMLIRGAPDFRQRYLSFLDTQITDPELVSDVGARIRTTSRAELKQEHLRVFRGIVEDSFLGGRLGAEHQKILEAVFAGLLDESYRLTHAVLRGDRKALDRYNRLFELF